MIISQTPFRISFAGGGTDIPDFYQRNEYGAVVSTAIDKYVYLAIHRFFEKQFMLKYSQTEICETIDQIRHPLIRECLRMSKPDDFVEISSFADIPSSGSGLGSSSAFCVGLLNALSAHKGHIGSREKYAAQACEIEIERLEEPIGKQDQYATSHGGFNYIRFNADGEVQVEPILLSRDTRAALESRLLLFYTGATRQAAGILTEQKRNLKSNSRCEADLCRIRDQADRLREALTYGNLEALGEILHEGWMLKRSLASSISNAAIDDIYIAAKNAGASGGKLLGAGGGGFFLLYVEPEKQSSVCEALAKLRRINIHFERQGTRIIYAGD